MEANVNDKTWQHILRKSLKIAAIAVAAVAVIVVGLLTAMVVILSPGRLTPLVEKYSSEYIDGYLTAQRIELTFWNTFPRLSVDIDSLTLVSDVLSNLDEEVRRQLPSDADTLLSLRSLHGGLNLMALMKGRYELYDVAVSQPTVNIVVANDSVANYNIVTTSENDTVTSGIPSLSINRFLLLNSGPLKYFSLPDSTEFALRLTAIDANGAKSPIYSLSTEGDVRIAGLPVEMREPFLFAADGKIIWNPEKPAEVGLKSFTISVDGIPAKLETEISFADTLTIKTLEIELPSIDVTRATRYIPAEMLSDIGVFDTNMNAAMSFSLSNPYNILPDTMLMPSGIVALKVLPCRLTLKNAGIALDKVGFDVIGNIDGTNIDRSTIEVKELNINSKVLDLDFMGLIRNPISDPLFAGRLKGRVNTWYLPAAVKEAIGGKISGIIGANLSVRLRQSDLSSNCFHEIFARGTLSMRQFDMEIPSVEEAGDTIRLATPAAFLTFDSDRTIEINGVKADSLLTVAIKADSISYSGSGVSLLARDLNVGLGSLNVHSSVDTTRINPFGGRIRAAQLRMVSLPDSMKVAVNMLDCNASLRRFEGLDRVPLLSMSIAADGIAVGDSDFRAAVKSPMTEVTAHLNARRKSASDSINTARVNRNRKAAFTVATTTEDSLSAGLKKLISRWKISGQLSAERGRVLMRSFPLPTLIDNVNLAFSSDSIDLRSLSLRLGHSDMDIKGSITNIEQWAQRRHPNPRYPLKIGVKITSDTVDIDQLAAACLSGIVENTVPDSNVQNEIAGIALDADTLESDYGGPFIVPVNLEAMLDVKAKNVIYTDMLWHNFSGELQTRGGIMRLRDFSAQGDMGKIDVSALYSSLSPDSLEFGMGMKLSDFYIDRFLHVMPSIDSLLPAMRDLSGIVNADIAATTNLDNEMNFVIPSLKAMIDITGDSLVLLDDETFKSMSKWLVFKNKKRNLIDRMSVKISVDSSIMSIYPFVFDIDRYRLGVMGSNDLDMNFNYHVSVIKSPLPWKFGINLSGNPDNMKIRLGGAKVKENGEGYVEQLAIADTTRINLIGQLEALFNRGVGVSRSSFMKRRNTPIMTLNADMTTDPSDTVPEALPDSLMP